ncbi:hypothetical protein PanWU01x14_285500 [Parasponia andersonii]|uniref:Uncharacterized protein n=1 Tax=Parasponia andersonii TaxID=3476 RepID=A0A2P5AZL9_PARAD|nr:hypothetical protein PanWU01x14_285500 [Parasponia andersonii]
MIMGISISTTPTTIIESEKGQRSDDRRLEPGFRRRRLAGGARFGHGQAEVAKSGSTAAFLAAEDVAGVDVKGEDEEDDDGEGDDGDEHDLAVQVIVVLAGKPGFADVVVVDF